jgi:uncharacterized protein GlcG (DUF336 family)
VVDAGGHLIAAERQDGATFKRIDIASGKAVGALSLGVSSRKIAEMTAERPQFMAALSATFDGVLIPSPGGVIVQDGNGTVVGAVGISGDLPDKDEACTLAGIAAAGLTAMAG